MWRGAVPAIALLCLTMMSDAQAAIRDGEELTRFGQTGSGAGELSFPLGVASDPKTGHIVTVDLENSRISEFTPWGNFVKAFGHDVAPGSVNEQQEVRVRAAGGQFKLSFEGQTTGDLSFNTESARVETALNALPTIGSGGTSVTSTRGSSDGTTPHVYVVTFKGPLAATDVNELEAIDGSTPLSGGKPETDELLVRTRADGTAGGIDLESCTEESGCKAGVSGSGPGQLAGGRGIAVDLAGGIYVKEFGNRRVQKFDPAGRFVWMAGGEVDKTTSANLCIAASGDLCGIGEAGNGPGEFAATESGGIAFCPSGALDPPPLCPSGAIFAADEGRIQRFSLGGAYEGELAVVPGETIPRLAFDLLDEDLYVTVSGSVYELDGATGTPIPPVREPSGGSLVTTNGAGEMFADSEGKVFQFNPAGALLDPPSCCSAEPGFSLGDLATNKVDDLLISYLGPDSFIRVFGPPPVIFEGPPSIPPTITAQFAASVQRDGASVAALINPHFFTDATYFVEYGTGDCDSGGCPNVAPVDPAELTKKVFGQPVRTAGVSLEGLAPGTTYNYRFVAESGGGGPVEGPKASFTTPDPLSQPPCPNDVFRGGASSRLPNCRAYEMVSPIDKNNGDIKTLVNLIGYDTKLGQASADGNSASYSSSVGFDQPKGALLTNQYVAKRGWESDALNPGVGVGADINVNPEVTDNPFKLFSEDLCHGWFVVSAEPLLDPGRDFRNYQNVYRRDLCSSEPVEALLPVQPTVPVKPPNAFERFAPELQGASADGSAAIIRVRDKLTANAPANRWVTYYAKDGGLKPLCVLPNGDGVTGNCSGGTGFELPTSMAGSGLHRVANVTNAISGDGNRVYWTDSGIKDSGSGTLYLRINPGAVQSTTGCEAGKACTVSVSGTKQGVRFLGATPSGSKALYDATIGSAAEELFVYDAQSQTSTSIADEVIGLVAASKDLARVYFVSKEDLADGASAGQPNLYLSEGGEKTFIATLSQRDVAGSEIPSNTTRLPIYHAARASADGAELAFISNLPLTGYDNADLVTSTPNSEVYLYEVGSEEPVCVSCNPSGQRSRGRLVKGNGNFPGRLQAAALLPTPENMLYTQRVISDDGERLFFESFDALLPRDTNGAKDVYEWESASSRQDCVNKGAELYVAVSGGCLSLISTGESPQDSEFLDASASGNDVFFITNASLLPQDPGLFDVYDARVNGGLPFAQPTPPCQGETCRPPATAPNDPTPSSSTYVGPGDQKQKAKKKKKKANKKKNKKGKSKKKSRKKAGKNGRAGR